MKALKPQKPPKRMGLDRPRHLTGQRGGHHNLLREALEEGQDVGPTAQDEDDPPFFDWISDEYGESQPDSDVSYEDLPKKEE